MNFIFPYVGNGSSSSQLTFIFFRGVGIPPTSNFSGVINDHDRAPFPTQGGQSDRTMSFCKERSDPHAVRDPW